MPSPSPAAPSSHRAGIAKAADFLRARPGFADARVAVVAGSGLGTFASGLKVIDELPYGEIPGFPVSGVVGHKGALLLAEVGTRRVIVCSGRSHLYEGYPTERAVFAVQTLARLGVTTLVVSNAAGGLNRTFVPGDLMVIRDHINFMFRNPLIGPNDDATGPRFPDMSEPYDRALGDLAIRIGVEQGIQLREGTYIAGLGPSYETRAEVRMLQFLGADAVGMSTAIETIAARHAGLRVLGITFVSNSLVLDAAPVTTHDEVMENARLVADKFARLVRGIVERLDDAPRPNG